MGQAVLPVIVARKASASLCDVVLLADAVREASLFAIRASAPHRRVVVRFTSTAAACIDACMESFQWLSRCHEHHLKRTGV